MKKKMLCNSDEKAALVARLRRLRPDSARQWGRMTPHQMVCHLSDSFRNVTGEREASDVSTAISRTVVRYIALRVPLPWPKGIKTLPEADQEIGGTKPVEFERDVRDLEELVERFTCDGREHQKWRHPIFGHLSDDDWQRWGYLHMDHHLRQFGV